MRYFEDITIGEIQTAGSYELTEKDIIEFAERWDPWPFHTDVGAANASPMHDSPAKIVIGGKRLQAEGGFIHAKPFKRGMKRRFLSARTSVARKNTQRATMGRNFLSAKGIKPVRGQNALDHAQRQIRKMLVVDCVKLAVTQHVQ